MKVFRPVATKNITNILISILSLTILLIVVYAVCYGIYTQLILINASNLLKLLYILIITVIFITSVAIIPYSLMGQKIIFEKNIATIIKSSYPFLYKRESTSVDLNKVNTAIFHKRFVSSVYKYYRGYPDFYYAIKFVNNDKSEIFFYIYNWRWFDVDQIKNYLSDNYKNIKVIEDYDKVYDDYPNKYY